MLILITQEIDTHSDWVEAECRRRGEEYLRLCTEQFPTSVQISTEPAHHHFQGEICVEGRSYPLSEVVGLWYRRPGMVELDPSIPEGQRPFSYRESQEALTGLYRVLYDRRWVSPPHIVAAAGHKIHQLRLAKELGFTVAPTLVTNDPAKALSFFEACRGQMIYKPLRFVPITDDDGNAYGIYTTLVTEETLDASLDSIALAPCLFQQLIPKDYEIRVNIIGNRVWASSIHSQESEATQLDCRHDLETVRQEAIWLPPEIERLCLRMKQRLRLNMCNIDLIVTPEGEYLFLEVNPNGQWAWIEELTGLPLRQALVDELLGVDTLATHPYLTRESLQFETELAS
ncbi:MAG: MvdC/MvdD family ATP grasp protein [Acidobacteriota bacterium]